MKKSWKRIVSVFLALAMVILSLPEHVSPVKTAKAVEGDVTYVDENNNTVTLSAGDYEVIDNDNQPTTWTNGKTYVVGVGRYAQTKMVTVNTRIEVSGSVKLVIMEGYTLSLSRGIHVTGNNALSIYGEGALTARLSTSENGQDRRNAAIGGNNGESAGTILIAGCTITVRGGYRGAGIGGGRHGNGGQITILGGNVNATGTSGGAGIGGGGSGNGGTITISGGTVTANGGSGAAGIGGGSGAYGGTISISGGSTNVTAIGGASNNGGGAGIGGGSNPGNYTTGAQSITISGGKVTATSGNSSTNTAAIGGGYMQSHFGSITISGGEITATGSGSTGTMGIGGYQSSDPIYINGGVVNATSNYSTGYGIIGSTHIKITDNDSSVTAKLYSYRSGGTTYGRVYLDSAVRIADTDIVYEATNGSYLGNQEVANLIGNKLVIAYRLYTVRFLNENGDVLQSEKLAEGSMPEYKGAENPKKEADKQYTYSFKGWDPEIAAVTGDKDYKAVYNAVLNEYEITFVDSDGTTELAKVTVAYGDVPVYPYDNPTKESDPQYTYTFSGWTPALTVVTGKATYKATYNTTTNRYTIKFVNWDGETLEEKDCDYGIVPTYTGATPTKRGSDKYSYTFAGWDKTTHTVDGTETYTATFTETINKYTIRFLNENGDVLQTEDLEYDTMPKYKGNTPEKEATAQYTFNFSGWDSEITTVTGNKDYRATYGKVVNKYEITFLDDDGTELAKVSTPYGSMPVYPHNTPTKEPTAQYSFTFAGWSPALKAVEGTATYTATYTNSINSYKITFKNADGRTITSTTVEYGKKPVYNGNTPTKPSDEYAYTFTGWKDRSGRTYAPGDALADVTGEEVYTAQFSGRKLYNITVEDAEYGSISLETDTKVPVGDYVTLYVCPASYCLYVPNSLKVVSGGVEQEYSLVGERNDTFTFLMPDGDVTISAEFCFGYPVWIGGTQITTKNASDVLGDGNFSFVNDSDANKMTLTVNSGDEITLTGTYDDSWIRIQTRTGNSMLFEIVAPNGLKLRGPDTAYGIRAAYGVILSIQGNLGLRGAMSQTAIIVNNYYDPSVDNVGLSITGNSLMIQNTSGQGIICESAAPVINCDTINLTTKGDVIVVRNAPIRITASKEINKGLFFGSKDGAGIFCYGAYGKSITITGNVTGFSKGNTIDVASGTSKVIVIDGDANLTSVDGVCLYGRSGAVRVTGNLTATATNNIEKYDNCVVQGCKNDDIDTCIFVGGNANVTNNGTGYGLQATNGPVFIGGNATVKSGNVCINMACFDLTIGGDANLVSLDSSAIRYANHLKITGNLTAKGKSHYSSGVVAGSNLSIGRNVILTCLGRDEDVEDSTFYALLANQSLEVDGDVTVTAVADQAIYGGQGISIHGNLKVVNTQEGGNGVLSSGGDITMYSGVWEITTNKGIAMRAARANIVIPETHHVTVPEDGEIYTIMQPAEGTQPARIDFSAIGIPVEGSDEYEIAANAKIEPYVISVTFLSDVNGEVLAEAELGVGDVPVYQGTKTPTKASDPQYTYAFDGWTKEDGQQFGLGEDLPALTVDDVDGVVFTAHYANTTNKYQVKFVNDDDQETVLQSSWYEYGKTPAYTGSTPTKARTPKYTFTFRAWSPAIHTVDGTEIYKATYNETVNKYTITFVNYNGAELQSGDVPYDETPEYKEEKPTRLDDGSYRYSFIGWKDEDNNFVGANEAFPTVTKARRYTAQYSTDPLYKLTVDKDITNGIVRTDKSSLLAVEGEEVVITVELNDHCILDEIKYSYNGQSYTPVLDAVNSTETIKYYTFAMPAADVTITAALYLTYPVWVGDTQVTEKNASNVLGDTGTPRVTFEFTNDAMILNVATGEDLGLVRNSKNKSLISAEEWKDYAGKPFIINAKQGLTLRSDTATSGILADGYKVGLTINGNVTIELTNESSTTMCIHVGGNNLTVEGNVSLTAKNGNGLDVSGGTFHIKGNVEVNAGNGFALASRHISDTQSIIEGNVSVTAKSSSIQTYGPDLVMKGQSIYVESVDGNAIEAYGNASVEITGMDPETPIRMVASEAAIATMSGYVAMFGNVSFEAGGNGIKILYKPKQYHYDAADNSKACGIYIEGDVTGTADQYVLQGDGIVVTGDADLTSRRFTAVNGGTDDVLIGGDLIIQNCVDSGVLTEGDITIGGNVTVAAKAGAFSSGNSNASLTPGLVLTFTSEISPLNSLQDNVLISGRKITIGGSFKATDTDNRGGSLVFATDSLTITKDVVLASGNGIVGFCANNDIVIGGEVKDLSMPNGFAIYSLLGGVKIVGDAKMSSARGCVSCTGFEFDGKTDMSVTSHADGSDDAVVFVYGKETTTVFKKDSMLVTDTMIGVYSYGDVTFDGDVDITVTSPIPVPYGILSVGILTFGSGVSYIKTTNGTVINASEIVYPATHGISIPEGGVVAKMGITDSNGITRYTIGTVAKDEASGDETFVTAADVKIERQYTVAFVDENGQEMASYKLFTDDIPAYKGEEPGKKEDERASYQFEGWRDGEDKLYTGELPAVDGDATYKVSFAETIKKYEVLFYDEDGRTQLSSAKEYEYGTKAADIVKPEPTREATKQYTYTFVGWTPVVTDVTGPAAYVATYEQTVNKYNVRFLNEDGSLLQSSDVEYGKLPVYTANTPQKAADAQYTYTFKDWDATIVTVTGDAVYKATYTATEIKKDDPKQDDPKQDDPKQDDPKQDDPKQDDPKLQNPEYEPDLYSYFFEGDPNWKKGSKVGLRITFKRTKDDYKTFGNFEAFYVNGKKMELGKGFTAKAGSLIIDITPEFLETLPDGTSKMVVSFKDSNDVTVDVAILPAEAGQDVPEEGKTDSPTSPKTDDTMVLAWLIFLLGAASFTVVLMAKKRDEMAR